MRVESLRQFSAVHFCSFLDLKVSLLLLSKTIYSTWTANAHPAQEINAASGLIRTKRLSVPPAQTVILMSEQGSKQKISDQQSIRYTFCAPKFVLERFSYHHVVCGLLFIDCYKMVVKCWCCLEMNNRKGAYIIRPARHSWGQPWDNH